MKSYNKTKEQLLKELDKLNAKIAELEKSEIEHLSAEQASKKLEDVLKQSEEQFRALMEQSSLAIQIMTPDGRIVQVNDAYEKLWGITIEDLSEYNISHDGQAKKLELMPYIKRAFAGETLSLSPFEYDALETIKTGGKKHWIQSRMYPVKNKMGEIQNVVMIHEDITESKKAEKELSMKETQYRGIFEASKDAFLIFDLNGVIKEVNSAACKMYDYSNEEIIGLSGKDIVHPDYQYLFKKFVEEATAGKTFSAESIDIRKDGSFFDIEIRGSAFEYKGKPHLLAVVRDITKRKRAEEALQESEERFRQVAESAEEWIWEVDDTALYTYASPIVEKLLGYKPEEIVGKKHSYDMFHPDDIEPLKKVTLELFAEKKPLFRFLNRNVHKNGNIVWLSTSGLPVIDNKGNLLGYRGADTDVTKQKNAEEELQKYREHLEELVKERTKELEEKNKELERMNSLFVGREFRIKELRDKVNELEEKLK